MATFESGTQVPATPSLETQHENGVSVDKNRKHQLFAERLRKLKLRAEGSRKPTARPDAIPFPASARDAVEQYCDDKSDAISTSVYNSTWGNKDLFSNCAKSEWLSGLTDTQREQVIAATEKAFGSAMEALLDSVDAILINAKEDVIQSFAFLPEEEVREND